MRLPVAMRVGAAAVRDASFLSRHPPHGRRSHRRGHAARGGAARLGRSHSPVRRLRAGGPYRRRQAVLVRKGASSARHRLGLADRAAGRRITDRTIYHWASVTKTLTAIAVLQLRDRGMLSLDDRVTRWVPELREIHDPEGGGRQHHRPDAAVALRPGCSRPPGRGRAASRGSRSSRRDGASWWR